MNMAMSHKINNKRFIIGERTHANTRICVQQLSTQAFQVLNLTCCRMCRLDVLHHCKVLVGRKLQETLFFIMFASRHYRCA